MLSGFKITSLTQSHSEKVCIYVRKVLVNSYMIDLVSTRLLFCLQCISGVGVKAYTNETVSAD